MFEYIKIAWRNIWRNRRRSLITMSSIFFATFLALIMRSFQLGTYDYMINSVVEMYSGFIQIENADFPDEPLIDNVIPYNNNFIDKLQSTGNVKAVVPRLGYFAFASAGNQTKGVMLSGIQPELENEMTQLENKMVKLRFTSDVMKLLETQKFPEYVNEKLAVLSGRSISNMDLYIKELKLKDEDEFLYKQIAEIAHVDGEYLEPNDEGVLLGDRLSKYMKLNVGDTLVLIGQGYHGASAAGKFPVRGIIRYPNPVMDNSIVYTSLKTAQNFFSLNSDNQSFVTSYAINLDDKSDYAVEETLAQLHQVIADSTVLARGWKDANKTLVQQIESDNESGKAMLAILYIVIAFGVFGTVLMMIAERKREMGVMIALGMKKFKLASIITFEMIFISMIGLFAGILVSIPLVFLGYYYPLQLTGEMAVMMEDMGFEAVMPMAWFGDYYLNQIWVVVVIVLLVMIYPLINIYKLKVIQALRA